DGGWEGGAGMGGEVGGSGEERAGTPVRRRGVVPLIGFAAAIALIIGVVIGAWTFVRRQPAPLLTYSAIDAPQGNVFAFDSAPAVVSPDGKKLAFVARASNRVSALCLRSLSA